jgi:hypothetical protein
MSLTKSWPMANAGSLIGTVRGSDSIPDYIRLYPILPTD